MAKKAIPCGHTQFQVIEFGTAISVHEHEHDGEWSHNNDFDDYQTLEVKCGECGKVWQYSYVNRRPIPQWVTRLFDDMEAYADRPQEIRPLPRPNTRTA